MYVHIQRKGKTLTKRVTREVCTIIGFVRAGYACKTRSRDPWLHPGDRVYLPSFRLELILGCNMDRLHHCSGSPTSMSQSQLMLSHYLRKLISLVYAIYHISITCGHFIFT